MFEREIKINRFQLGLFDNIVADIPETSLYQPGAGHGHPPAWILGHLAIAGEMGQRLLGGHVTHSNWIRLFGPRSSGDVPESVGLTREELRVAVVESYRELRKLAADADEEAVTRPHGIELFADTPIKTMADAVAVLLTNHFGFHSSQLSSCRRSAGHGPLF